MQRYRVGVVLAAIIGVSTLSHAQESRKSPRGSAGGSADGIVITYGRPHSRYRSVFGPAGLVPYGRVWRTGADEATSLRINKSVRIGTLVVPPGEYLFFTIPDATQWTVIVNRRTGEWGSGYEPARNLGSTKCEASQSAVPKEQFTITVRNADLRNRQLAFEWDTAVVLCPVTSVAGPAPIPVALTPPIPAVPTPKGPPTAPPGPLKGRADRRRATVQDGLWKSSFFTLAEGQAGVLSGPVATGPGDAAYNHAVFRLLLKEADGIATSRHYQELALWRKYSAFLLGALVVPWHESGWLHFRRLSTWRCDPNTQKGPTASEKHYKVFSDVFVKNRQLADCGAEGATALQLLGSGDGVSTGLMQVAFGAYPDYYTSGAHLDVAKAIHYGLGIYFKGFTRLWNSADRYACITTRFPDDVGEEYRSFHVIRASWAGAYNYNTYRNGIYPVACRIATVNDRDKQFRTSLTGFQDPVGLATDLGLSPAERAVLQNLLDSIGRDIKPVEAISWLNVAGS